MANQLYKHDFESDSVGSPPSGWTEVGTATVEVSTERALNGTKGLKVTTASSGHRWIWDEGTDPATGDFEVRVAMYFEEYTSGQRAGVAFRAHDDAGTDKCYAMMYRESSGDTMRLSSFSGTSESVITTDSSIAVSPAADQWLWVKASCSGSYIRGQAWLDSGSEPEGFEIETTDATYDNTNQGVGIYHYIASTNECHFDDLTVYQLNAIDLQGTGYVTVANYTALDDLAGTMTVEGWFKQNASGGSAYDYTFSLGINGGDWAFYVTTENASPSTGINFGHQYATTNADGYQSTGVFQTSWTHVAIVFENGQQTKVYVNGSEISYALRNTPAGAVTDSDSMELKVGVKRDNDATRVFHGEVACFRMWNTARSGTEINDNKDYWLDPAEETGLIINCNVDDEEGTTVANDVPSSNNGALTNNPYWCVGPTITAKSYVAATAVKDIIGAGVIPFER